MNNYKLKVYLIVLILSMAFLYNIGKVVSFPILFLLIFTLFKYGGSFFGSSWKPIRMETVKKMVKEAEGCRKIYDMGSGDGRLVINAANNGLCAYGIEIEPVKWLFSNLIIKIRGIKNAKITLGNFFNKDVSDADAVFLYLPQETVDKLQKNLKFLKKGAKVISHVSKCSELKLIKEIKMDKIYVYRA